MILGIFPALEILGILTYTDCFYDFVECIAKNKMERNEGRKKGRNYRIIIKSKTRYGFCSDTLFVFTYDLILQ